MRTPAVFLVLLLVISACTTTTYVQDENKARESGDAFLKAIMDQDYKTAYDTYLSPGLKFGTQGQFSYFLADWQAIIEKFGKIDKAVLQAWQPAPGKHALQLYYQVVHEKVKEPVTYHLVLEGDQTHGYTVFIVDIGNVQPYPPQVHPLPEKIAVENSQEIKP